MSAIREVGRRQLPSRVRISPETTTQLRSEDGQAQSLGALNSLEEFNETHKLALDL